MIILLASGDCNEGEVRLVNGTEEREGRLEVCANGVWGTVCATSFTRSAAYIVCKQLGYNDSDGKSFLLSFYSCPLLDAIINTYGKYGTGDKPIVYSNVDCFGSETSLRQCDKRVSPAFTCSYRRIVGLKCLDSKLLLSTVGVITILLCRN